MNQCESPHLHVEPIDEDCLDGEGAHTYCNQHRSMCMGDTGPCLTCGYSYEASVYHIGKDTAPAMGPVEQHKFEYRSS